MYPPLWTSLLVAMHDDIEDTSIVPLAFLQMTVECWIGALHVQPFLNGPDCRNIFKSNLIGWKAFVTLLPSKPLYCEVFKQNICVDLPKTYRKVVGKLAFSENHCKIKSRLFHLKSNENRKVKFSSVLETLLNSLLTLASQCVLRTLRDQAS